jgi:hypothetical protein
VGRGLGAAANTAQVRVRRWRCTKPSATPPHVQADRMGSNGSPRGPFGPVGAPRAPLPPASHFAQNTEEQAHADDRRGVHFLDVPHINTVCLCPPPYERNGVAKCVFPGTESLKWRWVQEWRWVQVGVP